MTATTDIALVGVGKIARDQHLPAIAASPAFRLAATADPAGGIDGIDHFDSLEALLDARPDVAAVALCVPPQARHAAARTAPSRARRQRSSARRSVSPPTKRPRTSGGSRGRRGRRS